MNALGLTHLSFRVDDLETTLHLLERYGAQVLHTSRTENPDFRAAAIFVTDPDGTRIELIQQSGDPSTLPGQ
jgi:catechol 2,3-dioxygenase-like lactoylglutathione lyase family enzyme